MELRGTQSELTLTSFRPSGSWSAHGGLSQIKDLRCPAATSGKIQDSIEAVSRISRAEFKWFGRNSYHIFPNVNFT